MGIFWGRLLVATPATIAPLSPNQMPWSLRAELVLQHFPGHWQEFTSTNTPLAPTLPQLVPLPICPPPPPLELDCPFIAHRSDTAPPACCSTNTDMTRFFCTNKQKLRRSKPGNYLLFSGSRKPPTPTIHCRSACTTLATPIFRHLTQNGQSCEACSAMCYQRGGNTEKWENPPSPSANMGHLLRRGSTTKKAMVCAK